MTDEILSILEVNRALSVLAHGGAVCVALPSRWLISPPPGEESSDVYRRYLQKMNFEAYALDEPAGGVL